MNSYDRKNEEDPGHAGAGLDVVYIDCGLDGRVLILKLKTKTLSRTVLYNDVQMDR